ncbi:MAG TPA: hypothetical protein VF435_03300 [Pyrinomonadaceae bacterium]
MTYRPWGLLDWTLSLTAPRSWTFVGALSTEERSLAAWQWLSQLSNISHNRLLDIRDFPSRYAELQKDLLSKRGEEFRRAGGNPNQISPKIELLTELHRIVAIANEISGATEDSLVLDITSLPKRFSFPLLRHFYQDANIKNLLLTYTLPEKYSTDLSENATDWLPLPGFHGDGSSPQTLVVGIGFMVENLQSHIATINRHEAVKVLIPMPAPLPILYRTWEALYRLESPRSREKFDHYRVGALDMSSAFDRIASLSRESDSSLSFAPFGPKPLSAAMCLFAFQHDCAVYYPQPRIYNPLYSTGVGVIEGKQAVFGYWVKHDGIQFYIANKPDRQTKVSTKF